MKFLRAILIVCLSVILQPHSASPMTPPPDAPDLSGAPEAPPGAPDLGGAPEAPPGVPDLSGAPTEAENVKFAPPKSISYLNKYFKALDGIFFPDTEKKSAQQNKQKAALKKAENSPEDVKKIKNTLFVAFLTDNVLHGLEGKLKEMEGRFKLYDDEKELKNKPKKLTELQALFDLRTPEDILAVARFKISKILSKGQGKLTLEPHDDVTEMRALIKTYYEIFIQAKQQVLANYFNTATLPAKSYLGLAADAKYAKASPSLKIEIFKKVGKFFATPGSLVFTDDLLALPELTLITKKPTDQEKWDNDLKRVIISLITASGLWPSQEIVNAWIETSNKAWDDVVTPPKKIAEPVPEGPKTTFDPEKALSDWYQGMESAAYKAELKIPDSPLAKFPEEVQQFVYSLKKIQKLTSKQIQAEDCRFIINNLQIPDNSLDQEIAKYLAWNESTFKPNQMAAIKSCLPPVTSTKTKTLTGKIQEYINLSIAELEAAKEKKLAEDAKEKKLTEEPEKPGQKKPKTAEELLAEFAAQAKKETSLPAKAPAKTPAKAPNG